MIVLIVSFVRRYIAVLFLHVNTVVFFCYSVSAQCIDNNNFNYWFYISAN